MDTLKEIWEKILDIFFGIASKFDGISEQINRKTGMNINVGVIVLGALLVIIFFFVVKGVLGFLWSQL